jgi:hypothetical protein
VRNPLSHDTGASLYVEQFSLGAARGLEPECVGVFVAQRFPAMGRCVLTDHPRPVYAAGHGVEHVDRFLPHLARSDSR